MADGNPKTRNIRKVGKVDTDSRYLIQAALRTVENTTMGMIADWTVVQKTPTGFVHKDVKLQKINEDPWTLRKSEQKVDPSPVWRFRNQQWFGAACHPLLLWVSLSDSGSPQGDFSERCTLRVPFCSSEVEAAGGRLLNLSLVLQSSIGRKTRLTWIPQRIHRVCGRGGGWETIQLHQTQAELLSSAAGWVPSQHTALKR